MPNLLGAAHQSFAYIVLGILFLCFAIGSVYSS